MPSRTRTTHATWAALAALAAAATPTVPLAAPNPQVPIAGQNIPQFKQPLPTLSVMPSAQNAAQGITAFVTDTPSNGPLQLSMCEVQAKVLPPGTFAPNQQPLTRVWTYRIGACPPRDTVVDTYVGPVLVNLRNRPTSIRFTNGLPTVKDTQVLAYKYGTDQTIHWADPLGVAMPSMPAMPDGPETNNCHMMSGNPPMMYPGTGDPAMYGIPAYKSACALNYGEFWDSKTGQGGFDPAGIPAVPHLHGGEVPPAIDGGPNAWFTSLDALGLSQHGHGYYSDARGATNPSYAVNANEALYSYPNTQGAAPLWFHDHTLGATRLNVYAGLAGGYYLLDPAQEEYFAKETIQMRPVTEVVPIVLQDRMFDKDGQLYYPTDFPGGINGPTPNPQHPYWNPEFIGDTIVVNGKVWPYLNVEARRYRFLFLNGSNARAYEMFFTNPVTKTNGPGFWVIGNDDAFLDNPAYVDPNAATNNHLVMQPGERYEVIVDFTNFANQTLVIKNVGKAPYPGGKAPQGTTLGQLMQFRVGAKVADSSYDPASGKALRPAPIVRLASAGAQVPGLTVSKVRELTLNEAHLMTQTVTDPVTGVAGTVYPGGPVEILVNNTLWSGESTRPYGDFTAVTLDGITEQVSETPGEGTVELWEIVNTTMDAHPIHTHLASFQILNRQAYDQKKFLAVYNAAFTNNLPAGCPAGLACPGYGPPYDYDPANNPAGKGKWGGNPDVTPFLANAVQPPLPQESGWKDTFIAYPGMVNRFLVRWAPQETPFNAVAGYPFSPNDSPTGAVGDSRGYVWHCHIIDHEDNEMMRPDVIVPLADAPRSYVQGQDF